VKVVLHLTVDIQHESYIPQLIRDLEVGVEEVPGRELVPPVPFKKVHPLKVIEGGKE
jgi:hypothetical protein